MTAHPKGIPNGFVRNVRLGSEAEVQQTRAGCPLIAISGHRATRVRSRESSKTSCREIPLEPVQTLFSKEKAPPERGECAQYVDSSRRGRVRCNSSIASRMVSHTARPFSRKVTARASARGRSRSARGKRRQTKGAAREPRSPAVKLHDIARQHILGSFVQGAENFDV